MSMDMTLVTLYYPEAIQFLLLDEPSYNSAVSLYKANDFYRDGELSYDMINGFMSAFRVGQISGACQRLNTVTEVVNYCKINDVNLVDEAEFLIPEEWYNAVSS